MLFPVSESLEILWRVKCKSRRGIAIGCFAGSYKKILSLLSDSTKFFFYYYYYYSLCSVTEKFELNDPFHKSTASVGWSGFVTLAKSSLGNERAATSRVETRE